MSSFTVSVKDEGVLAMLNALHQRLGDLSPALRALGETMQERTKQRFESATAPDGSAWQENSLTTLMLFARGLSGSHFSRKSGELNGKGLMAIATKFPLTGHTRNLRREIHWAVSGNTLTLTAARPYAAIQHYGGVTSAKSMIPGKTIPARPFMPIRPDGDELYPAEQRLVIDVLRDFLLPGNT